MCASGVKNTPFTSTLLAHLGVRASRWPLRETLLARTTSASTLVARASG
jgi:hypothetical protein